MSFKSIFAAGLAAITLGACSVAAPAAPSDQTGTSEIVVKDAWSRLPVGGMAMTAAYMMIENKGTTPDSLMSISSDVAGSLTLHETKDVSGVMQMQALPNGLDIPANGSVTLKPAGYHIMVMDMKRELKVGETYKVMLKFRSGKELPVDVMVREL